jgi:hypothetical protein
MAVLEDLFERISKDLNVKCFHPKPFKRRHNGEERKNETKIVKQEVVVVGL